MNKKPIGKLYLTVAVILIICAVFVFGKFFIWPRVFEKDPRAKVLEALANMAGEIKTPEVSLYSLYSDITSARYSQDISFGITGIDVSATGASGLPDADPRVLSALEMISFKNNAVYDPAEKKRSDNLTVSFAVTPLARLRIITEPSLISVSVPQAFDYDVTVDPARVASEWDASVLGTYAGKIEGIILEEQFHQYYTRLLFPEIKPKKTTLFDYLRYGAILDTGAEYVSLGKTPDDADICRVNLKADSLNNLLAALIADYAPERFPDDYYGRPVNEALDELSAFRFTEDVSLIAEIKDERLLAVGLAGENPGSPLSEDYYSNRITFENGSFGSITGKWNTGRNDIAFGINIKTDNSDGFGFDFSFSVVNGFTFGGSLDWNPAEREENNFFLALNFTPALPEPPFKSAAAGKLTADEENKIIDVQFDSVNINDAADISLGLTLRPSTEAIAGNEATRPLSSVNEFDLLEMYSKILEDEAIGPLITQYLP